MTRPDPNATEAGREIIALTRQLCAFATGVVAPANQDLFARIARELSIKLHRYPSGAAFNGWLVPQMWQVDKAIISKDGQQVFDGTAHPLGVAVYSRSFQGELDLEDLKAHLVTNPRLPQAYVYHCMWQYRPWAADWALCVPYETYQTLAPGRYRVDLKTAYEPGEMLVGAYEHPGQAESTIVFNAHTCHPHMANDDMAGVAVLIRLFQWLQGQKTRYTYRLVLGPEHLGTVFYLRDQGPQQLARLVSGVFAEMPGTPYPLKIASSFLGGQTIDLAFRHAARHYALAWETVPWRQGAGNDETVWEAPGYEVPFVEVSRARHLLDPYPEYHTSLDSPDLLDAHQLEEFFQVLVQVIWILEHNCRVYRKFDGLLCLSNPAYDLYQERPDPAVAKDLAPDSEKWGYFLDCLLRYLDGSLTILDMAEKHDLPFARVYDYLLKFAAKGLVSLEFAPILRRPVSRPLGASALRGE